MIGQLILCRNIEMAQDILKAILIIARSETEGETKDNNKTICEEYKIKMKNFLAKGSLEEVTENMKDYNEKENEDDNNPNKWSYWAKNIDEKVKILLADNGGDRENAHYMPKLADYLMKDIKLLPLWSCLCRDKFGFGRIPASSASVESDFNIVKNIMLKTEKTPMRADEFVAKHVNFISGRLKIIRANIENIPVENAPGTQDNINQNKNYKIITQNKNQGCPACENGHEPTGGHTCYVKNIYMLWIHVH